MKLFSPPLLVFLCASLTLAPVYAAIDYSPSLGDNSAYTVEDGTKTNYSFSISDGSETKYYQINVKTDLTNENNKITWQEVSTDGDNTVSVEVPYNGSVINKYYKYTYTQSAPQSTVYQNKYKTGSTNGGALYNSSSRTTLNADFKNNYISGTGWSSIKSYGGALYNTGNIGTVNGYYTGNYINISGAHGGAYGGAIYNTAQITSFNGDFVSNYIQTGGVGDSAQAGALYNKGTITTLTGNFISNYVLSNRERATGGAISNFTGTIETLSGDFINNYADGEYSASGGAIDNNGGVITDLIGNFINNHVTSRKTSSAYGGAISGGNITNLTGNFIANYASTQGDSNAANGGAISGGNITNLTGDFIGNYTTTEKGASSGGAISNTGISILNGDFIGNHAVSENSSASGGAFYYSYGGTLEQANSNFIQNYAKGTSASGGAIYKGYNASINNISGDFIENYAQATKGEANGGAIYYYSDTITSIIGNFIRNNATTESDNSYASASGGAISNGGTIETLTGNFIENYAKSLYGRARGGAISTNPNKIVTLTGNFLKNYAQGGAGVEGGAIFIYGEISTLNGNFEENYAYTTGSNEKARGGAIYDESGTIQNLSGDFIKNYAYATEENSVASGGAIYKNSGTLKNVRSNFEENYVKSNNGFATGGAIDNNGGTITDLAGDFIGNYAESKTSSAYGGAIVNGTAASNSISNLASINLLAGDFKYNYAISETDVAYGGAIYNKGMVSPWNASNIYSAVITSLSGDFIGNYATTDGGAIYNGEYGEINIIADTKDILFQDNLTGGTFTKSEDGTIVVANAKANDIYNEGEISLKAKDQRKITLNGSITDNIEPKGTLNIGETDSEYTGEVYLNDSITQQEIKLNSGTLNLGANSNFANSNVILTLNGGTFNSANNFINVYNIGTLNLNQNTAFIPDVDLKNKTMDKFSVGSAIINNGAKLNIPSVNLISDTKELSTTINFTKNSELMKAVKYSGSNELEGLAPIYKYNVSYDNESGNFSFKRSGSGNYDDINPAAAVAPVAAQSGAYSAQTNTFSKAFQMVDTYMSTTKTYRQSLKMANKYAMAKRGDYTISPNISQYDDKEAWINPYTTFEKIPLKRGPKVSNIAYGTLIGTDSELIELKRGFSAMYGGYIAYNGSHQRYDGVSVYQNGGSIGITGSLFKGNFFTGVVVNAGASQGKANTYYGDEDFTTLMAGIASKTGYNIELFDGKLIFQPNYYMSYSFVNTFDYTNAAGVRISSKPIHAIQIEPGIKIIGNLKNGWQPYAGVSVVFNPTGKTQIKADDYTLPSMYVKPYAKYGVGLRKNWKDRFSCFVQAFVTSGGRNGVGLQAGFTWALGKDKK